MIKKDYCTIFKGIAVFAVLFYCSCKKDEHLVKTFFRMDTVVTITIADKATNKEQLWRSIDSLLQDWEQRFSDYGPHSEVLRINRRSMQTVSVSHQMSQLVSYGIKFGQSTKGLFDFTILPLKNIWGLGEIDTIKQVPSQDTLSKILTHVDFSKVTVDTNSNSISFADPLIRIDLGGVAKAFALQAIDEFLWNKDYRNYLVNGGGDIIGKGHRKDKKAWRIGIQHPRKEGLLAAVSLDSGYIFTSGDYERFWMNGQTRVHHIFNPTTGYSCTNNQSVTIVSHNVADAKNYSTGLFCLPADSIIKFVEERKNIECIVVDSSGTIKTSNGIRNKIQWL